MMGHYTTRARISTYPGCNLKAFHSGPVWEGDARHGPAQLSVNTEAGPVAALAQRDICENGVSTGVNGRSGQDRPRG